MLRHCPPLAFLLTGFTWLLLASILILFMTALVIFDAGTAAQDKMDVQIGADAAAVPLAADSASSASCLREAAEVCAESES